MTNAYDWIPFYESLANKLLGYDDKRRELFEIMKSLSADQPFMKYLHFEREDWWGPRDHIVDPFTILGALNRWTTDANRKVLAKAFANTLGVDAPVPSEFAGIPTLNNRSSFFTGDNELWNLLKVAIRAADTEIFEDDFAAAFDSAIAVKGNGLTYITMGLYWIRPRTFMPLDSNSRNYISENFNLIVPKKGFDGTEYINFLNELKSQLNVHPTIKSYPEISHTAWLNKPVESDPPEEIDPDEKDDNDNPDKGSPTRNKLDKNIILYGTPGTGKTYSSVQYAVAIIEEKDVSEIKAEKYDDVFKRYLKYKDDGLIAFTTFHQSFSYEEFIEGIRPVVTQEDKTESKRDIEYEVHNGIFKAFCDKAGTPISSGSNADLGIGKNPTVWKVSLEGTGDNPTRTECLENNHIRIGWDDYGEIISDDTDFDLHGGSTVISAFYNRMQIGDIVMSCYSSKTIDAIGVITGEPEWHDEYPHYKRLRSVKWLVKEINEDIVDLNGGKAMTLSTVYKLSISASDALQVIRKVNPGIFTKSMRIPNRVFIIDEINRGNISRVFGELITLIEPTKRINACEESRSQLPYSGQKFGVPENVYIIGTMNTADRSIAMIDTALRRRFSFIEMKPDSVVLKDVIVNNIDIAEMLEIINKRITVLLDREHTIGHSYLLPLKADPSVKRLATIFEHEIIPLLQEYFYDDYEKIGLVLGDNQKEDDQTRFIIKKNDAATLFGDSSADYPEYYEINREAFTIIDAYAFIQ